MTKGRDSGRDEIKWNKGGGKDKTEVEGMAEKNERKTTMIRRTGGHRAEKKGKSSADEMREVFLLPS